MLAFLLFCFHDLFLWMLTCLLLFACNSLFSIGKAEPKFILTFSFDFFFIYNSWCPCCIFVGIPIDKVAALNQNTRDYVGTKLLELTLKELFVFRFMQAGFNRFLCWKHFCLCFPLYLLICLDNDPCVHVEK